MHDLSKLAWFIDEYAAQDARKCGQPQCAEKLEHFKEHIDKLLENLCSCGGQEGHSHEHQGHHHHE